MLSMTNHEGDAVASQTVGEQLGEFALSVGDVATSLAGVTQTRDAVTWHQKLHYDRAKTRMVFPKYCTCKITVLICCE